MKKEQKTMNPVWFPVLNMLLIGIFAVDASVISNLFY